MQVDTRTRKQVEASRCLQNKTPFRDGDVVRERICPTRCVFHVSCVYESASSVERNRTVVVGMAGERKKGSK